MIRIVLATAMVFAAAAAHAQDETKPVPAEKPISELKFFRSIESWKKGVRLTGTEVQKQEQWKTVLNSFADEIGGAHIEFDGVVTDVTSQSGRISISYKPRSPDSVYRGLPVKINRVVWILGDDDLAKTFSKGDRFSFVGHLRFTPRTAEVYPPGGICFCYIPGFGGWNFGSTRRIDGCWFTQSYSLQFGKRVFEFDRGRK